MIIGELGIHTLNYKRFEIITYCKFNDQRYGLDSCQGNIVILEFLFNYLVWQYVTVSTLPCRIISKWGIHTRVMHSALNYKICFAWAHTHVVEMCGVGHGDKPVAVQACKAIPSGLTGLVFLRQRGVSAARLNQLQKVCSEVLAQRQIESSLSWSILWSRFIYIAVFVLSTSFSHLAGKRT